MSSQESQSHHTIGSNPYVLISSTPSSERRATDRVFDTLNRCGKKMEDATRKAEAFADGVRNHLKFSPSIADAAMARLAQGTKLITEGHHRVFQQEFGIFLPGEKLLDSFACYVSTTSGPIMGTIYVSSIRVSFCSDYPLRYPSPSGHPPSAYYKVMLRLEDIRSISPSANRGKPSERYIHVVMQDGFEFWFMGFVSHDKAFKCLNHALQLLY
ncbi:PREDICTED: GEM-like protein 2 [Tarenaya hassleriana]|uniref:GEM-like protein 2 n=1 Tax=Tarenaya hassleriana TaxID=28532 RepID=UPI00053C8F65|nr:PREDICTED: GEM-like protein 2 [Tarenaya hassleriana]